MRPCAILAVTAFLLTCLAAVPARAGAWQRAKGAGFAMVSAQVSWPQDLSNGNGLAPTEDYQTFYLEYGLRPRLTLGLDLGRSVSGGDKTVVFFQVPLRDRDTGPKVALQMGLGRIDSDDVVRPGLSVGWGRERGWLSIDMLAEMHAGTGRHDLKLDVTWGRNLAQDRKLIVQMQSGLRHGDPAFARIVPSYVVPLGRRLKAEIGGSYGLAGDSSMGLKFGLWTEF
ncbi:hypothetical protein [Sagittula stellata]|uniref:Transporter n=1 Tax=Sagittula stellata (strain ATCC 700073 / DSM 11524 / E-37) TaxID=388399 RepID=A3K424_SAGS3|nr:hypothetical protein [Sagittula stellata]EBA08288.1 hypothetical protein SSE37_12109 [Sagittula stellata E-37]